MSAPTPAGDKVVQLLVGTLGGCVSLGFCFYWFWGIAWIIPAIVAAGLSLSQSTRQIGIGFAAAASGALVAVVVAMSIVPGAR